MDEVQIVLRKYDPETDEAFIYATWLNNCWYALKGSVHKSQKTRWYQDKASLIKEILHQAIPHIACFKNDPYLIAGYMIEKDNHLEWVYIKEKYRNQGIEELLLKPLEGEKSE